MEVGVMAPISNQNTWEVEVGREDQEFRPAYVKYMHIVCPEPLPVGPAPATDQ